MKKMLKTAVPKGAATKLALLGAVMVLAGSQCTGPTVVVPIGPQAPVQTTQPTTTRPTTTRPVTTRPTTQVQNVDCIKFPNAPACLNRAPKPNAPTTQTTTVQTTTTTTAVDCGIFPNAPACLNRVKTPTPTAPTTPTTVVAAPTPATQSVRLKFVSVMTGKCLSIFNGQSFSGAQIVQNTCATNRPDQHFLVTDHGGGATTFKNTASGMCVTVDGGDQRDGIVLVMRQCNSTDPSQLFNSLDLPGGGNQFRIRFAHSGKCIDVPDGLPTENLQILQWQCDGSPQQVFTLTL